MCTRCLLLHTIYILGIIRLTRFPFSAFPWSHLVLRAEHRTAYIIHMPHICHRILECNLFPLFTCNSKFNFIDAAVSFSIFSYHASLFRLLSLYPFLSLSLALPLARFANQWRTNRTCSHICVCVALVIYDCDYGLTIVILQWQIKFHKIYWIKCATDRPTDRVSWRMMMQKLEMNTTFTMCMRVCVCVWAMFAHRLRFISIKFWNGLF